MRITDNRCFWKNQCREKISETICSTTEECRLRAPVNDVACGVTVLVLDDELVAVGDAELLLAGVLVTPPTPDDVSDEVPMVVVEKDVVGVAVGDSELDACVPLAVDVSGRTNVQKLAPISLSTMRGSLSSTSNLSDSQDGCSYVLRLMK